MKINLGTCLALLLAEVILFIPAGSCFATGFPGTPSNLIDLRQDLRKPYLKLFRISPSLRFTPDQINQMRSLLEKGKSICLGEIKKRADQYSYEIRHDESHLQKVSATITNSQRHNLHCKIQNLRFERAHASVLAQHAIPIAYANEEAKLDLIQNWPADLRKIKQEITSCAYLQRR